MATETAVRSKSVALSVVLAAIALIGGCAGAQVVVPPGSTPGSNPGRVTTQPGEEQTDPPIEPSGTWTGTMMVEAVVGVNKTTHDTSGNPGDVYYETSTTTETDSGDSTDTFAINAQDQSDLQFGIHTVDLKGTASTQGNEDLKVTIVSNKQNSGCTWTEEVGDETSGAWTDAGAAVGELSFYDDGSYRITIHASTAGPNGEQPDGPQIDHHSWIKNSDISAGCTGDPVNEFTEKRGPLLLWASSSLEQQDVNYQTIEIRGQISAANPGTAVDGTSTWKVDTSPEVTLTATWHLVHSIPIILPHD